MRAWPRTTNDGLLEAVEARGGHDLVGLEGRPAGDLVGEQGGGVASLHVGIEGLHGGLRVHRVWMVYEGDPDGAGLARGEISRENWKR